MMSLIITVLTVATTAIHMSFFLPDPGREWIYGLNALGYMTLLAMLYLPLPQLDGLRRPVRILLMGFAGLTILAYLAFGLVTREWTVPLGPLTKLIEATLIGLLWWQDRQSSTPGS